MSIAEINGTPCASAHVVIPRRGVWYADVTMIDDTDLSGRVDLVIGSLTLAGTVTEAGTRGEQAFYRITAGAGAWATELPPKAYHSDARVTARTVAADAAREAGETLETLTTTADMGVDYVRRAGPASRALEAAVGSGWYVDLDGVTRVGERTATTPAAGAYLVVDEDPRVPRATLEMDDLAVVGVGATLTEGFDTPLTVREIEIRIDADRAVMIVWGGGGDDTADRLGDAFRRLVARPRESRIWGLWRYRVSKMSGARVKLQAIAADAGLPDLAGGVDQVPGLAGAHAELTPGALVLVQFVEGDPRRPVVTQYAGRAGPGHVPTKLRLALSSTGPKAARNGDAVEVVIPSGTVIVSVSGGSGAPAVGTPNPTDITLEGTIVEGSDIVEIG